MLTKILLMGVTSISLVLAACGGGSLNEFDLYSESYGSIAINPKTKSGGIASKYTTQRRANNSAISSCGGAECVVVLEFDSSQCGVLARSNDGAFGWASDWSESRAKTRAIDACTNNGGIDCSIELSGCN